MSKDFKGILLAGGQGTRLYPLTAIVSKQLQPIYDKPMVYYPLTTMMLAGVRDVLLITNSSSLPHFKDLLGDGKRWGITLTYAIQDAPNGIAEALVIGETFLSGSPVMLVLGDNLIYGRLDFLRQVLSDFKGGALVFAYRVSDPSAYGVVAFDEDGTVSSLEEKPRHPKSGFAVPGLYLYDGEASSRARRLERSARGELEITDLNRSYLSDGKLVAKPMGRGIAWLDTGTPEDLLKASHFVQVLEARQGLRIGCPEEVALHMGYLDVDAFEAVVAELPKCPYRAYLETLAEEVRRGPGGR